MRKKWSIETIQRWLRDEDWRVRTAAMNACKRVGIDIPVIRTIEPPERVYKKCLCGVIVVAEIPSDAQIRGTLDGECRCDKAKIVDIIGDICGEKVGISLHNLTTQYFIGDEIVIDDFDYSNQKCSTGFHFFCTKEQAESYEL